MQVRSPNVTYKEVNCKMVTFVICSFSLQKCMFIISVERADVIEGMFVMIQSLALIFHHKLKSMPPEEGLNQYSAFYSLVKHARCSLFLVTEEISHGIPQANS